MTVDRVQSPSDSVRPRGPLAPWLPPRTARSRAAAIRPFARPEPVLAEDGTRGAEAPVTVGVDVTVSGSRAVVVGAEIADQFRALATALAEQAESAEIVVSATLLLGGGAPAPAPAPRTAGLQVLPAPRSVLLDGEHVEFTRREFDLLLFLARQPGRVHTRSQLLQSVWGHAHISGERTVDVHIRRIRFKLRAHQSLVTTVRGVGYRFDGSADVVAEENAVL